VLATVNVPRRKSRKKSAKFTVWDEIPELATLILKILEFPYNTVYSSIPETMCRPNGK